MSPSVRAFVPKSAASMRPLGARVLICVGMIVAVAIAASRTSRLFTSSFVTAKLIYALFPWFATHGVPSQVGHYKLSAVAFNHAADRERVARYRSHLFAGGARAKLCICLIACCFACGFCQFPFVQNNWHIRNIRLISRGNPPAEKHWQNLVKPLETSVYSGFRTRKSGDDSSATVSRIGQNCTESGKDLRSGTMLGSF